MIVSVPDVVPRTLSHSADAAARLWLCAPSFSGATSDGRGLRVTDADVGQSLSAPPSSALSIGLH